MTKIEKKRCEKLIEEAERDLEKSDMEYSKYERLQKEGGESWRRMRLKKC